VVADVLGVKLARVKVIQGDTDICPYGLGNYSSRSIAIGASSAGLAAGELRQKILTVAGRMLEALVDDMDAEDDRIFVKGRPEPAIPFDEVVKTFWTDPYHYHANDLEPGLESTRYFKHGNVYHDTRVGGKFNAYPSWPNAAVACIVEVDPEQGVVKVLRYCMVHDSGMVVNPMLAEGNIQGGVAQGLGGALYEHLVYDDSCQLKTASFMDYTLPTAVEMPPMEFAHQVTRSPFTPLGTKGVGESGVTGILGAICGAVENALPHLELEVSELPLKPHNVWRMIRDARPREARS
jgi:carbon-monoxide dehydrogenase large subunit